MNLFNQTPHQKNQIEVINKIASQVKNNNLSFSTVSPMANFNADPRLCLTSVHLLHSDFVGKINLFLVNPLKKIQPEHYYYPNESFHATIKNIKVIADPPNFTEKDVQTAKKVFSETIPNHNKFSVYFYRLLLFPNNLALIGTTDEELDRIILELVDRLKENGIVDDKKYLNSKYFFCNITLVRFIDPPNEEFKNKVAELSEKIPSMFEPYTIDSVTLLSANAALKKRKIYYSARLPIRRT